ncbi:hypothetical protein [Ochrobactrum sp. AN78]|uniref:hypothetical protein n=1 Tax=Ochrobactrum sp. AN78 TaxID=3039853 RepID=UPI002989BED3|nr:hypothetical protein [Ochrobactrum sp. AN78]
MPQIDRKREQYAGAMGTSAADSAAVKDPFVAWEGFKTSFENLSAAIGETVIRPKARLIETLCRVLNNDFNLVFARRSQSPFKISSIV